MTVTNLTRGQSFTPILVATHEPGVKLFTLGQVAIQELAILAEASDVGPLSASLIPRTTASAACVSRPLPTPRPGPNVPWARLYRAWKGPLRAMG